MKRIFTLITTIIIILCVTCGNACSAQPLSTVSASYAKSMIITDIVDKEVIGIDKQGEEWSFFTEYHYRVGDTVICIMDDNGTDSIYDDAITLVTYNNTFIKS